MSLWFNPIVRASCCLLLGLGIASARTIVIPSNDVDSLVSRTDNIASGDTLLLSPGTYGLVGPGRPIVLTGGVDNVALIGAGAQPDSVTITSDWTIEHCIYVMNARHVTVKNLRLQYPVYHCLGFDAAAGAFAPRMSNLHLVGAGQQFIKVNTGDTLTQWCDSGVVEDCVIEYESQADDYYTDGVDVHAGAGWVVRDNVFRNIRAPEWNSLPAGAAILFWNNAVGTIVERNLIVNCDQGISMGDPAGTQPGRCRNNDTAWDNRNCIVRNNIIWRSESWNFGDVGITLVKACSAKVYNNTVVLDTTGLQAMDCRIRAADVRFYYNLVDGPILDREGAVSDQRGNIILDWASGQHPADWFVNPAAGDLHLIASAPAVDSASTLSEVADDYDRRSRPVGPRPDVGADEYGNGGINAEPPGPPAVSLLSIAPNPVRNRLQVEWTPGNDRERRVAIFNAQGQRVADLRDGETFWVPAAGLPNGVYVIRASCSHGHETQSIVLLH